MNLVYEADINIKQAGPLLGMHQSDTRHRRRQYGTFFRDWSSEGQVRSKSKPVRYPWMLLASKRTKYHEVPCTIFQVFLMSFDSFM